MGEIHAVARRKTCVGERGLQPSTDRPADLVGILESQPGALSATQVARLLGFGVRTIYSMADSARIPHFRIGSSIRFDGLELARWLQARKVVAA